MVEFVINIGATQKLDLTFTPNPNSSAFVNGIEIVSIPDKLYLSEEGVEIKFENSLFDLNSNTALENLYRLNMGGGAVDIGEDSGPTRGMFRGWSPDDDYIFCCDYGWTLHDEGVVINYTSHTPSYTAPPKVYKSARTMSNLSISLEWGFLVDSGFYYLLRFHFCDFWHVKENDMAFTVNVNNQTADTDVDVIYLAGGPDIPIFKDYITWVPDVGNRGKQDLRLSLVPCLVAEPRYISAWLNGLEIFKLNDSTGSFAASNPELIINSPPASLVRNLPAAAKKKKIGVVVGSVIGVVVVVAAVAMLIMRRWKVKDAGTSVTNSSWSLVSLSTESRSTSDTCRYLSIDEIKAATSNFDDSFIIGRGGFGRVYKGLIRNVPVAIKRLNSTSRQGTREFLTEIDVLFKLRHLHLVSLVGYCGDEGEMILVYDYMAHGSLRDHLYNSENSPLTWKQRLQICVGAAKGLDYLHSSGSIIHRDIKSSNILLDEKWVAKVSDFGLSKMAKSTHVSTVVKGSLGYVDPEYYRRKQLTLKSDVYSFGVVLLEVLCARPPIIATLPREQVNLAEWAAFCYGKGTVDQIVDSNLKGQIAAECLSNFAEIAVACLVEKGIDRPSMNDIVRKLEFVTAPSEWRCTAVDWD